MLGESLSGHNVFDFRSADAEGQRAERSVRCSVAIAAHNRHAGHSQTLFRSDHMHDSLTGCAHGMFDNPELGGICAQHINLLARDWIGDGLIDVGSGDVVIFGSDREFGATNGSVTQTQTIEGLR
ncbi:unannotated protein [freshwater metagenome]|uniref:Unannotated protein n=1 Tax=freshwater metagenome TaxID=449393 RepID=A0A6J6YV01_9ZZZZ